MPVRCYRLSAPRRAALPLPRISPCAILLEDPLAYTSCFLVADLSPASRYVLAWSIGSLHRALPWIDVPGAFTRRCPARVPMRRTVLRSISGNRTNGLYPQQFSEKNQLSRK
jgi:hypothetical protein